MYVAMIWILIEIKKKSAQITDMFTFALQYVLYTGAHVTVSIIIKFIESLKFPMYGIRLSY